MDAGVRQIQKITEERGDCNKEVEKLQDENEDLRKEKFLAEEDVRRVVEEGRMASADLRLVDHGELVEAKLVHDHDRLAHLPYEDAASSAALLCSSALLRESVLGSPWSAARARRGRS